MTVNTSRSMTEELDAGSIDGKYKRIIANRSNVYPPDLHTERMERSQLSERYYDVEEAPVKLRPDGKPARIRD